MYIVLETHGGADCTNIVKNEVGENKVFMSLKEVCEEAEKCQSGRVVEV